MKKIVLILILTYSILDLKAQELKCKVNINASQVQGIDPKLFKTLELSLTDFVNTRKWSNDVFDVKEKIECVFNLIINKTIAGEEGGYTAKLSIQSTRPVFNSNYASTLVNYTDKDVSFRYIQFQTVDFNDNRVSGTDALASNLPAIFAYYCNIILGLDYDSFSLKGGSEFFNKALNIVNNAPENKAIFGWSATEGQRNRFWLIDQMMNPRFVTLRESQFKYHRKGLDLMTSDPEGARATINDVFPVLHKLNQDNPSSLLMQFWFNAKSDEVINFLQQSNPADKQRLVPMLVPIDVSNAAKYAELLK